MKKVKNILSSVCDKVAAPRATACITAALVVMTSVTCGLYFAADNKVSAKTIHNDDSQKMILELSEDYLSPNSNNSISILEAVSEPISEQEVETAITKEENSGSENEAITETQETEAVVSETKAAIPGLSNGYSFEELGLTQMSEIPVPDNIRFDENGIPLEYRYKISGKTTTYIMGHTTATGTSVHPGVVAVNPKIIPYGTKMYIIANDGSGHIYGYASAEDTGGFIYLENGPLVDMYVWTMDDVYAWGNKPVDIYIF